MQHTHAKARIRKGIQSTKPTGSFSNIPQDVEPVLSLFFHSYKPIFTHEKLPFIPTVSGSDYFLLARNASVTQVLREEVLQLERTRFFLIISPISQKFCQEWDWKLLDCNR